MAALPPGVTATDRVVLFDGECVMCSAGAMALLRIDRHALFKLGTVQSPEGKRLLEWHGLPTDSYSTFILSEGSNLYVRSSAYVRVVARLGFPWNIAAALWVVPRPLRDWAYDLVARNRFKLFGKRAACLVPSPADRHRFLSATLEPAPSDA